MSNRCQGIGLSRSRVRIQVGALFVGVLSLAGSLNAQKTDDALLLRLKSLEDAIRSLERQITLLNVPPAAAVAQAFADIPPIDLVNIGPQARGASSAAFAIIEYSDFECPFCAQYHRNVFSRLDKDSFRPVVLGTASGTFESNCISSSRLSYCARTSFGVRRGERQQGRAHRLHVTPGTGCKLRGRFLKHRLEVYDEPDPVRNARSRTSRGAGNYSDAENHDARRDALEDARDGLSAWSTRRRRSNAGVSTTTRPR